jgi:hypothetical protein
MATSLTMVELPLVTVISSAVSKLVCKEPVAPAATVHFLPILV